MCSRAPKRASAPAASRGASCTSPSPRSICRRIPIPTRMPSMRKAAENLQRMIAERVRPARRTRTLLRLSHHLAGPAPDGPRLRRGAGRLRERAHPQARADHAREGNRSRAPDRGAQRADRPGDDGLSARAGDRQAAEARHRARSRCGRHGRRRCRARAVGDCRHRADRRAHARIRCRGRALHRRRPPPLGGGRARVGRARR